MTVELRSDPETGSALAPPNVNPAYRHDFGAGQSTAMGPVDVVPRGRNETDSEYLARMAKRANGIAIKQRSERYAKLRAAIWRWVVEAITTTMQLAGLTLVSYGLFTWIPWVGIVAGGLSLILVSVAIDPPKRRFTLPRRSLQQPGAAGIPFVPVQRRPEMGDD